MPLYAIEVISCHQSSCTSHHPLCPGLLRRSLLRGGASTERIGLDKWHFLKTICGAGIKEALRNNAAGRRRESRETSSTDSPPINLTAVFRFVHFHSERSGTPTPLGHLFHSVLQLPPSPPTKEETVKTKRIS